MKFEKIGIFGGTFSPPHLGHAAALKSFLEQEKPDEMLVIPTGTPPHKPLRGDATTEQRFAMCRLAFSFPGVTVSDLEIKRGGKSYTVDTLKSLTAEDRRLVLLCGTDMFLSLDTWYSAETIFRLAEIVYVRREKDADVKKQLLMKEEEYRSRFAATVRPLATKVVDISSSGVRERLANGKDASLLLHPDVKRYIEECNLYRN